MKMTFQPKKRQRSKVHGFRSRAPKVEEKYLQAEERKEEKYYQRRPHICGLFFYKK